MGALAGPEKWRAIAIAFVLALQACATGSSGASRSKDHRSKPSLPAPVDSRPPGATECRVRRAAFDVGSATTKVKVADVDLCRQRIVSVLLAREAPVFYREDVAGPRAVVSASGPSFHEETMQRGLAVLADFKRQAERFAPRGYRAVATAAFRRAANGRAFAERIHAEIGIVTRIISQGEEAELGFVGAVAALDVDPRRALVWDVGGQSMQMTYMLDDGGLGIYQSQLSSGPMRDHVMREVQHKDDTATTPNPISVQQAASARAHAADLARREISDSFKARLADPHTVVVGLGAIKYYGDTPSARTCTLRGVARALDALIGKTDEQIGGDYAATQVSDRLLIAGFMEALGIDSIRLADVDLCDGLLFHTDYWSP